nr:NADH dehydrogenase subunit 4 [Odontofroggatia galili]
MMKFLMFTFMLFFMLSISKKKIIMLMMNYLMFSLMLLMILIPLSNNWKLIYLNFSIDIYSMILIYLSILILSMMLKMSNFLINKKLFSLMILIMNLTLIFTFCSMNYLMFYLFFEFSLIPMYFLIMGWGYQPERINASMYMMFYTLFASLPMLIFIMYMYEYFYSLNFMILLYNIINSLNLNKLIFYFFMIFAFLVKLPMFMFHSWLPKAHLEAPVTGSMLLAGVMLKLGGYGLMRTMMIMMNYSMLYNYVFIIISIVGMIYLSLYCITQIDMKLIVALSSVVHMGICLIGMLTMIKSGFYGGFIMMISHGLCSSGMFILVQLNYEKVNSRNMFINKGMNYYQPTLMMWWFLFCMINMSAPISLSLMSEIFVMNMFIYWLYEFFFIMMMSMFFCTLYNLYLYSYIYHGYNYNLMKMKISKIKEFLILMIHWIPSNFMIMKLKFIIYNYLLYFKIIFFYY